MASDGSHTMNYDNEYATTWKHTWKESVNNIFYANPLWAYYSASQRIRFVSGGNILEFNLEYKQTGTITAFGKGSKFTIAEDDFLRPARYEWKYVGALVLNYFADRQKNRGEAKKLDLMQQKISNIRRTFSAEMERMMFADGTGQDSMEPMGLAGLIAVDPTATADIGQIPQGSKTWWRNQTKTSQGSAELYLINELRYVIRTCMYFGTAPDIGIGDATSIELYEEQVEEQKQIVNKKIGDAFFQSIAVRGIPLFWSTEAPSGAIRFINTEFLFPVIDPDFFLTMLPWQVIERSADDRIAPIVLVMEMCTTNRAVHGILHEIAA